jgi:hypothetical protein
MERTISLYSPLAGYYEHCVEFLTCVKHASFLNSRSCSQRIVRTLHQGVIICGLCTVCFQPVLCPYHGFPACVMLVPRVSNQCYVCTACSVSVRCQGDVQFPLKKTA